VSTVFSDDFNRADGGLGANWTALDAGFSISSNQVVPTDSGCSSYYNGTALNANCWAQEKLPSLPTGTDQVGVGIRLNTTSFNGYYVEYMNGTGTRIRRIDSGVATTLATLGGSPSAGQVVRIEMRGNDISVYYDDVLAGTTSDSNYTGADRSVILSAGGGNSAVIDDFATGNLPTISSATPSGTVATPVLATIGCTTDDASGTLYVVVDTASLSGITADQIKAGQNASSAAAVSARSNAAASTSPSAALTGLTKNTTYNYAILQFSGGNSNILTGSFTTADLNTFGQTSPLVASGNSSPNQDGWYWATKFTLAEDADVESLTVFFDFDSSQVSNSGSSGKAVIYADSSGSPGALKAVSSAAAIPAGDVAVTFACVATLPAGDYWLGIVCNSSESRVNNSNTGGNYVRKQDLTYASPADPMGTPDATGTATFAVFASYTPAGASKLAFTGGKILSAGGGKLLRVA